MNAAKFFLIATVLVACAMAVFAQESQYQPNAESSKRTKRFPFAAAIAAPVAAPLAYSYSAFGAYPYAAYPAAYPYAYPAFF